MKRWMFFAYGVTCYLRFLAIYAYLCGFTGNVLTPRSIDAPVVGSWQPAVGDQPGSARGVWSSALA